MLRKLANRSQTLLGRTSALRAFSSAEVAQSTQNANASALATDNAPPAGRSAMITLWQYSEIEAGKQAAKDAAEAGYLAELQQSYKDRSAFKPCVIDENDNAALNQVKKKINSIVE